MKQDKKLKKYLIDELSSYFSLTLFIDIWFTESQVGALSKNWLSKKDELIMRHANARPLLYSIPETAKMMGISIPTCRRLIFSGELKSIKVGERLMVTPDAIKTYLHISSLYNV